MFIKKQKNLVLRIMSNGGYALFCHSR